MHWGSDFGIYSSDSLGGPVSEKTHHLLAKRKWVIQARLIRSSVSPRNLNLKWSNTKAENSNIFMYPLGTNKWQIRVNIQKEIASIILT